MGGSSKSGGGSKINDYYGDIAGVVCIGPVDSLNAIIVDSKTVWTGPLNRVGQPNPAVITIEGYGIAYFYWGTANQTLATSYATGIGHTIWSLANPRPNTEDVLGPNGHPPYRRQAVMVLKGFLFGREKVSAPNVECIVSRTPVQSIITGAAAALDSDGQANPLAILAEAFTDPVFGLGIDPSRLDVDSWQATADQLLSRHADTYISPVIDRAVSLRSLIESVREYYDGWFRWTAAGKIAAGRFLRGESPPAFDSTNTITADDLVDEPSFDSGGWADTSNEVAMKFKDSANQFQDSGVTVTSGYNRTVVGEPRQVTLQRDYVTRSTQAAKIAAEYLRTVGEPGFTGSLVLRGARADGLPVGSLFKFTHDLLGLNLIARVVGRLTAQPPSETVTINFEADKSLAVVSTVPGAATTTVIELDPAERIGSYQFFQPPRAFFDESIPRLCVVAARTNPLTIGFNLYLQQADSSLFQRVDSQSGFAVKGLLSGAYSSALGSPDDNSETLSLTLDDATVAADMESIGETQSEDMVNDGNLIALIFSTATPTNFEILTVRAGRFSSGHYLLKVRRGRYGTSPRSFASGDTCYIIHKNKLTDFKHASFPSFASNSITAKFRLQSYTSYTEADLSDSSVCPDINFAFAPVDYSAPSQDDYIVPDPVSGVTVTPGYNAAIVRWILPTNVIVARTLLFESTTPVMPSSATITCQAPVVTQWFTGIVAPATRYYWLQVQSASGRLSSIAGPFSVSIQGINVADFSPGLRPVEIVSALPTTGNFVGRLVVLTTDAKLYRWTNSSVTTGTTYWSAAVSSADIAGTLADAQIAALAASKITGTLTDAQLSAIAAAKVTGTLTNAQITDGSISTAKIAAGSVVAGKLAAGAVTAGTIAANAVTAGTIAANAVTSATIVAGAITAGALDAGAVTAEKIQAGAVDAAKIAAGSVVAGKLAAGAVTAGTIAANAVTAGTINTDAVTAGAIAAGAITADKVGANQIITSAANIGDAIITSAKLLDAAITTAKIADAAITNAKIADASITNAKIQNLAVDTLKLANQAVTIPVGAYTAGSVICSGLTIIQQATIVSTGAPILIHFSLVNTYTSGDATFTYAVYRGSTLIYEVAGTGREGAYNDSSAGPMAIPTPRSGSIMDIPGAGTFTYYLKLTPASTSTTQNRSLLLLETKK